MIQGSVLKGISLVSMLAVGTGQRMQGKKEARQKEEAETRKYETLMTAAAVAHQDFLASHKKLDALRKAFRSNITEEGSTDVHEAIENVRMHGQLATDISTAARRKAVKRIGEGKEDVGAAEDIYTRSREVRAALGSTSGFLGWQRRDDKKAGFRPASERLRERAEARMKAQDGLAAGQFEARGGKGNA